jgi:hypothetical protein
MPILKLRTAAVLVLVLQAGLLLSARTPCPMLMDCGPQGLSSRPESDCHGGAVLAGAADDCCGDACNTSPARSLLSKTAAPGTPETGLAGTVAPSIQILPTIAITSTPAPAQTARGRPPIHLLVHALLI